MLKAVVRCRNFACIVVVSLYGPSGVIVLGECCPSGRDSSFDVLVLVLLADATLNYFYLNVLTRCVFHRHTLSFGLFNYRHWSLLSPASVVFVVVYVVY